MALVSLTILRFWGLDKQRLMTRTLSTTRRKTGSGRSILRALADRSSSSVAEVPRAAPTETSTSFLAVIIKTARAY